MFPGGMTLTVRELEALQLKFKTQEKEETNKRRKHGNTTVHQ